MTTDDRPDELVAEALEEPLAHLAAMREGAKRAGFSPLMAELLDVDEATLEVDP